jgi:hypothetical protein
MSEKRCFMGGLIVADKEYLGLQEQYVAYGKLAEDKWINFSNLLSDTNADAIISGNAHDNLVAFFATVKMLRGQFDDLARRAAAEFQTFQAEIDEADEKLY